MSLFVTSQSAVSQPGVFLIEVSPPTVIDGISNGFVGLVFQGEWGPVDQLYIPTSAGDMLNNYFPAGSPHNSTGYYATMRRKQVPWAMCRILGGSQGLLPPTNVAITQGGTAGSTSYSYTVTALNAAGETMASAVYTTGTGNATLSSGNNNALSWSSVSGATGYSVYRTAGGASQGEIATNQAGVTLTDTGLSTSGSSPSTNTSGWSQAVCNILDASSVPVLGLVGKYAGTLANSAMTATVAAASDGVSTHFNLTVTLTNAVTGSTTEFYPNLKTQATAVLPGVTTSLLLGSAALINTPVSRPLNGSYTFYNGSNGAAVSAADYQTGFVQLATDSRIRTACVDDCGDSIRAAVNANLQAHVDGAGNRMAIMHGSAANALSAVLTDVANYRDDRVIYCGSWVTVLDDVGTPQQSPFSTFIASAIANLEPQQSHAWYDDRVTYFYSGINGFFNPSVFNPNDDGVKNQVTPAGVCIPTRLESGAYAALHDRTTSLTTSRRFAVTRRIKDYLGSSIKAGIPGWVNGPNTLDQQRALKISIDDFLSRELVKGRLTAFSTDAKSGNSPSTIALGQFVILINGTSPAPMEQIFILLNVGPTVVVSAQ